MYPEEEEEKDEKKQSLKNTNNHRRLQKIKKSIKVEQKKNENKEMIGGKLFSFVTGEGTLKDRTQAL